MPVSAAGHGYHLQLTAAKNGDEKLDPDPH
jgi:hypothetical protein